MVTVVRRSAGPATKHGGLPDRFVLVLHNVHRPVHRWPHLLLKAVLTLGVLGALVVVVDPSSLFASLQRTEWTWVTLALLLVPINLFLEAWVWARLLERLPSAYTSRQIAGAVLCGCALGFWTPAQAGEYAGRSLFLPEGDRWTLSLTVFAQRMVDMTVGVVIGALVLGGSLYADLLPQNGAWLVVLAGGLAAGGGLMVFVANPTLAHRLARTLGLSSLHRRTAFFDRLSLQQGLPVIGGTLARYVVFTGQFVCLGLALEPSGSAVAMAAAVSLTFFAKYLIPFPSFLDLGLRESGAVFFFQIFGLGAATGLNAALLLFSMNVLLPAVLGVPLVTRLRLGRASSRRAMSSPSPP